MFDDDQPASIAPITERPPNANTMRRPASRRAICIGYVRSPNQLAMAGMPEKSLPGSRLPPNGITPNTKSTGVNTTQGAIMYANLSYASGRQSSFSSILRPSAMPWKRPSQTSLMLVNGMRT